MEDEGGAEGEESRLKASRRRLNVLQEKRAAYGKGIVATLSQKLTHEFGKGCELSAPSRMIRFSEAFPDFEIVAPLSRQLGWSHFVEIIPMKEGAEGWRIENRRRIPALAAQCNCPGEVRSQNLILGTRQNWEGGEMGGSILCGGRVAGRTMLATWSGRRLRRFGRSGGRS
jgi:hypothetical protein